MVLSRARWLLDRDDLKALGRARGAGRFWAVQQLRGSRRLPRWVVLADGDNELPVDLDNVLAVEAFAESVRNREQAVLVGNREDAQLYVRRAKQLVPKDDPSWYRLEDLARAADELEPAAPRRR